MTKKRKPKTHFTEAFRAKALEMLKTMSNADVARELKVSEPLLYAWKKRAEKGGPPPRLGRPPKVPVMRSTPLETLADADAFAWDSSNPKPTLAKCDQCEALRRENLALKSALRVYLTEG